MRALGCRAQCLGWRSWHTWRSRTRHAALRSAAGISSKRQAPQIGTSSSAGRERSVAESILSPGGSSARLAGLLRGGSLRNVTTSTAGETGGGDDQEAHARPSRSYGAHFLQVAEKREQQQKAVEESFGDGQGSARGARELDVADPEERVKMQLERLFSELPGHASMTFAYKLHCTGQLEPAVKEPLNLQAFEEIYRNARQKYQGLRRSQVAKRRRTRRNHARLNLGYSEEEPVYDPEEAEFQGPWRTLSMKEDYWKAEYYQQLHAFMRHYLPEVEPMAALRTDRLADVTSAALRAHISDENRPVLTHELSDFENPYMMKKSAIERILHDRCKRNQIDERVLPRLVERQPALVKLRARAAVPPEVIEPLAAFRGDVRWHFNARERLSQKLAGADAALSALLDSEGDVASVLQALPENAPVDPHQVPGVLHPWKNHVGFESSVPRGSVGSQSFGRPETPVQQQLNKLRYPTMQRVAHTLPKDGKWRAHVKRSVEVIERSKHWDYASKLRAISSLKEVYEYLKPSIEYTRLMDKKLPLNRPPSHLWKKYARGAQYVKTYPRNFRWKKTNTRYRASLTATAPLKKK